MPDHPIVVAGIIVPTHAPLFLAVLGLHVASAVACVVSGVIAMVARKGARTHRRSGTVYYRSLIVVIVTMLTLAGIRYPHDNYLVALGVSSFALAILGHRYIDSTSRRRIRTHIVGMGGSYVLLLVAFYVDNGRSLPLWRDLPPMLYWLLPVSVGIPLIAFAWWRHPLARTERRRTRQPST